MVKRLADLLVAVPLCVALLPLFAVVAVAIKLESRGPAFFVQGRRGLGFRPFLVIKFRSLQHRQPDPHGRYEMQADDPRITRVGRLLRMTSIDELPQLLNVIWGSMSLVGPRPLVEWESQEAWLSHRERYQVRPGITGLSQTTVRNAVDLSARLDKDVEYARRWSLLLDLQILLRTPAALVSKGGVYPEPRP